MAQWWERSPPTNVARVQIPALTPYVGWVCCWFSPLLREVFLWVLRFSSLLKNQHFQIPIRPGIRQTKNHFVDVLPPNHYLFIYLFIYLMRMVLVLIQLFHQHGKTFNNKQRVLPVGAQDCVSFQLIGTTQCTHVFVPPSWKIHVGLEATCKAVQSKDGTFLFFCLIYITIKGLGFA